MIQSMNNSLSTSYAQLASAFIAAFLCSSCATAQVDATEAVYKKALDFTVEIKTSTLTPFSGDSAGTSRGAGFVIDKSRGWVLTNAHVVSRSPSRVEVSVRNGDFVLANKLYVDPYLDLALLEVGASVQNANNVSDAPLWCGDLPSVGHPVGAFGHPLGFKYTGTKGIISGVSNRHESELLQTDAPINPGNSGGPLISMSTGKVIGVNTSTVRGSQNTNFAVSMKYACTIINLLKEGKNPSPPKAPVVYYTDLDDRKILRVAKTFLAKDLLPLQADDVILEVGNKPGKIDNETQLFDKLRGQLDAIDLRVERAGKAVSVQGKLLVEDDLRNRTGVKASGVLFAVSGFRDIQDFTLPRVRAHFIEPGSLGSAAELQTGDYLEAIDDVVITNSEQLLPILQAAQKADKVVRLKINRSGGNRSAFAYVDRLLKVANVSWLGPAPTVVGTSDFAQSPSPQKP